MIQTAKHTPHPSPWLVLDDGQTVDGGLTIVSVSHDGFRVAHVNPDVGDGHIHCAANATLIAAAPDLLEALEAAFVVLGTLGGNTINSAYRHEWELARAAIAKTGVK